MNQTTQNSRWIKASPRQLWRAFTDPQALEQWLAPEGMKGKIHHFDFREGGGYEMSLFYNEEGQAGKTSGNEDRYQARYIRIVLFEKIVHAIHFDAADPHLSGEMVMEVRFEVAEEGTNLTFRFEHIPPGIRPEDNEAGTLSTLEKLARLVE